MNNKKQIYFCKVSYDGYDWRNKVTITSPKTNKTISLRAEWSDSISKSIQNFFTFMDDAWLSAKFGLGIQHTEYAFFVEDLKELLEISKQ